MDSATKGGERKRRKSCRTAYNCWDTHLRRTDNISRSIFRLALWQSMRSRPGRRVGCLSRIIKSMSLTPKQQVCRLFLLTSLLHKLLTIHTLSFAMAWSFATQDSITFGGKSKNVGGVICRSITAFRVDEVGWGRKRESEMSGINGAEGESMEECATSDNNNGIKNAALPPPSHLDINI